MTTGIRRLIIRKSSAQSIGIITVLLFALVLLNWAELGDENKTEGERLNGAKHSHYAISDRLGVEARSIGDFNKVGNRFDKESDESGDGDTGDSRRNAGIGDGNSDGTTGGREKSGGRDSEEVTGTEASPEQLAQESVKGSSWVTYEATAYIAFCKSGCTGITATGYDVRNTVYSPEGYRVIAVDPSQIPLGSVVEVKMADGTTFKAKAMDTGGNIVGNRIDWLVETEAEALTFGRRDVKVRKLND